eukprot:3661619-Amphidinium_carterae.1
MSFRSPNAVQRLSNDHDVCLHLKSVPLHKLSLEKFRSHRQDILRDCAFRKHRLCRPQLRTSNLLCVAHCQGLGSPLTTGRRSMRVSHRLRLVSAPEVERNVVRPVQAVDNKVQTNVAKTAPDRVDIESRVREIEVHCSAWVQNLNAHRNPQVKPPNEQIAGVHDQVHSHSLLLGCKALAMTAVLSSWLLES